MINAGEVPSDCYVYIIFRPNGEPCYVGKGRRYRWADHNLGKSSNRHLASIIRKHGELPTVKVRESLSHIEAYAVEAALIAAIGREANGGPLVNLCDGGPGAMGYQPTPEQIARGAAARLGSKRSPETRARMGAWQRSPETCARISAAQRGKIISEEQKVKNRAASLGRVTSPETRSKQSAALLGRKKPPMSTEQKAKISATLLGNVAWNRGVPMSDAQKVKIAAAHVGKKVSKETREKMRASAANGWAKRRSAAISEVTL